MSAPFKMKGMDFGNSPVTKKAGPETKKFDIDKQVQLSEYENKKGTEITGGNKFEVQADLEDRIQFLEKDIKDGNTDPKLKAQLRKLKNRLNN